MTARAWHTSTYDPAKDPAVIREREMVGAIREHTEALRAFGARKARPRPTEHPVSELDRQRARKVVRERARKLGMIVNGED